jgi:hypothetical protein
VEKILPQDRAGFGSAFKAHPPVHIGICAGGCYAEGGPKDKKDAALFFSAGLIR